VNHLNKNNKLATSATNITTNTTFAVKMTMAVNIAVKQSNSNTPLKLEGG